MNRREPTTIKPPERNAVAIRIRWMGLAGFLGLTAAIKALTNMPAEFGAVLLVALAFAGENLLYQAHLAYVRQRGLLPFSKAFTEWQSLPDLLFLAGLTHFTGGIDSPFLYLPILSLWMAGSLNRNDRVVFILTGVSVLFTTVVIGLEYSGLAAYHPFVPGAETIHYAEPGYVLLALGVYAALLFVCAAGSMLAGRALRRRNQQLRDSEERYRDLVESMSDLVFVLDTEGNLTFVNRMAEVSTGYAAAELMGQSFFQLITPERRAVLQEAFRRGIAQGMPVRDLTVIALTKQGKRIYVEISLNWIRRDGKIIGARGVARDITERKNLAAQLEQRAADIARLYEASSQLGASLSLEETLQVVVHKALEATQGDSASVTLADEQGRPEIRVALGYERNIPLEESLRPNGVSLRVIASGQPAIFPNFLENLGDINLKILTWGSRAGICLPLPGKDRIIGVMWVQYTQPRTFSTSDVQLLQTFAGQAGIAISNARLYAREQRRATMQEAVSMVAREVASSLDLDTILTQTVKMLHEGLGYSLAMILMVDQKTQEIVVRSVATSFAQHVAADYRQKIGLGITGWVVREGKTRLAKDVRQDPQYMVLFAESRSELDIPLKYGDKVMGVLNLESDQVDAFSAEDIAVLEILADQIAIAINNAGLYQEVERRAQATSLIHEAGVAMTAHLTSDHILETALRVALQLVGANTGFIYLLVEGQEAYEKTGLDASGHLYRNAETRSRRGQGITGFVEQEKSPLVVEDAEHDPRLASFQGNRDRNIRSFIGVPMVSGNQVLGILYVSSYKLRSFTAQQVESVSILANTTAVTLANARLFTEKERSLAELAALNQISQTISSALELDEVLAVIHEQVGRLMDNSNFFIALYDETQDEVSFALAYEDGQKKTWANRRGGSGLTEQLIRHKQPLLIRHDLNAELTKAGISLLGREAGSWLGVPLLVGDKVLGVMAVQSPQQNVYNEGHQHILTAIANQAAIAIEKARLLQEAVQKSQQLAALYEVGKKATSLLTDAEALLPWLAEEAADLLKADAAGFRLLEGDQLVVGGRTAAAHEIMSDAPLPVGHSLSGLIVQENKPIVAADLKTDPRFPADRHSQAVQHGYCAFLGVPLRLHGEPVGVLNVYTKYPRAFNQGDVDLLSAFADQAAIAIENTRLYQALREQARRDSLTQVYNHGYFLECLHQFVAQGDTPLSMIMLDIDYFKEYNDLYGHVTGDLVLTAIVQAIRQNVHKEDIIGRWGGEEFGVLLPKTDGRAAGVVAERIRHTLATMPLVDASGQAVLKPTVSQGIATYPTTAASGDELVDTADKALYTAKGCGRDQICVA